MTAETKEHYETLLGPIYTREMAGGSSNGAYDAKTREFSEFFLNTAQISVASASRPQPLALDLGCGSGLQSIPLAELGYRVIGVDISPLLLAECAAHAQRRSLQQNIELVEGDLCQWMQSRVATSVERASVIVCMTDTLLHLPSRVHVIALVANIAAALCDGGKAVISFRDLVAGELRGTARFILLPGSTPSMLHTCFVETLSPDRAAIHDIVDELDAATGTWKQRVSVYHKLRLTTVDVEAMLIDAGLALESVTTIRGMVHIVATKH